MSNVDVDQMRRALEKALARVVALEGEVKAADRRTRDALESRDRARHAAGRAADEAATAKVEAERLRAVAPSNIDERELWIHRQWVYEVSMSALAGALCQFERGEKLAALIDFETEMVAAGVAFGFGPDARAHYERAYRKAQREYLPSDHDQGLFGPRRSEWHPSAVTPADDPFLRPAP